MKFIVLIILAVFCSPALAQIESPAREIFQVSSSVSSESVVGVSTARIVAANYPLLRKDFPHLTNKSESEIDNWLVEKVGFISKTQTHQQTVNTPIETNLKQRSAFRPPRYGRALVFYVEGGLIDGKGFGSRTPSLEDHKDGLATLGEMIREYIYQDLVQKIFDHSGSNLKTVGNYAVIDWGFRVKHQDGSSSPAGAILRQAHKRFQGTKSQLPNDIVKKVELTLRPYGLTSAGAHRRYEWDMLNVQGTVSGEIIDFGGMLAVQRFVKPAMDFNLTARLLSPKSRKFIQPNPEIQVPLEIWGTTESGVEDPKRDNVWIWSHQLAEDLASGRTGRESVTIHFSNLMDPVITKLSISRAGSCNILSGR